MPVNSSSTSSTYLNSNNINTYISIDADSKYKCMNHNTRIIPRSCNPEYISLRCAAQKNGEIQYHYYKINNEDDGGVLYTQFKSIYFPNKTSSQPLTRTPAAAAAKLFKEFVSDITGHWKHPDIMGAYYPVYSNEKNGVYVYPYNDINNPNPDNGIYIDVNKKEAYWVKLSKYANSSKK